MSDGIECSEILKPSLKRIVHSRLTRFVVSMLSHLNLVGIMRSSEQTQRLVRYNKARGLHDSCHHLVLEDEAFAFFDGF